MYATSIRILAKGYLPISLVTPSKLGEILNDVKTAIQKSNPNCDLVIDRLHLYYDMQFVTFSIDKDKKSYNTISSIHTTIHTTTTDTVSIRKSTRSHHTPEQTCTILHAFPVNKPYIALNCEGARMVVPMLTPSDNSDSPSIVE